MQVPPTQPFSLRIVEQPEEFHRFRYPTEIKGDKMGSLLHGKSGSKSYPKILVKRLNADSQSHVNLVLTCCTVSQDLLPHPYTLHGDNCASNRGFFSKDIEMRPGVNEVEVCLDRVCIVCPGKKPKVLEEAWRQRLKEQLNFFKKPVPEKMPFNKSNSPSPLRLAFQVYLVPQNGTQSVIQAASEPIATECIHNSKDSVKLQINEIFPLDRSCSEIWLYMENELKNEAVNDYKIVLRSEDGFENKMTPSSVKKCLVIFKKPTLTPNTCSPESRVTITLTDTKNGDSSEEEVTEARFVMKFAEATSSSSSNQPKRSRIDFVRPDSFVTFPDSPMSLLSST